ncbi:hypothetical protein [Krasilnikovia sp. M28-CT-15]
MARLIDPLLEIRNQQAITAETGDGDREEVRAGQLETETSS